MRDLLIVPVERNIAYSLEGMSNWIVRAHSDLQYI